jgi:hypothetical protein
MTEGSLQNSSKKWCYLFRDLNRVLRQYILGSLAIRQPAPLDVEKSLYKRSHLSSPKQIELKE